MTFSAQIWGTLSKIDCSAHIEKKGKLSYLSWTWAWATLMEHYPESRFEMLMQTDHPDDSVTVKVAVTISNGEDERSREMWLPVMDHKNAAIKNPDARQISDAKMRCLVKCLALFGLGHYIYAGEDVPESVKEEQTQAQAEELAKWRKVIEATADSATLTDVMTKQVPQSLRAALRDHATGQWELIKRLNENDQSNQQAHDDDS